MANPLIFRQTAATATCWMDGTRKDHTRLQPAKQRRFTRARRLPLQSCRAAHQAGPLCLASNSSRGVAFEAIPAFNKMLVIDLVRCDYIDRREIVILLGRNL